MSYKFNNLGKSDKKIIHEYFEYQDKYEQKFGKRTIFLMEIGSFLEYYGYYQIPNGMKESDFSEYELVNYRYGNVWDVADVLSAHISRKDWPLKPFMAGFPTHSMDKQVAYLLEASYTVVIMLQKEHDTSNPEREIAHIYSPGINITNLRSESNYTSCIYIDVFTFPRTQKKGISIVLIKLKKRKSHH